MAPQITQTQKTTDFAHISNDVLGYSLGSLNEPVAMVKPDYSNKNVYMDDRLYGSFDMKEIVCDNDKIRLCHKEKYVIGEISLKIYINGTEYASLLCLNQLTEELALGFLYSEGVIDTTDEVASISYNERLFAVMVNLVPGKSVEKCESLRSVTSGCGKCFTYINPLKHEKFLQIGRAHV